MSTTAPASTERAALRAQVYRGLWQAVWRFRRRTLAALALLVLAKLAAVGVPLLLKSIVDRFGAPDAPALELQRASPPPGADLSAWLVVPAFLMIGYALLRFAGTLFTELRDLVFARVTVGTVAGIAERVYGHLLALSPRFHAARNTGALVRDVERGVAGTGFLLGAGLFTVLPTLFELLAILVVMTIGYSGWFTVIIVSTFAVFAIWTTTQTVHREVRQRRVNELDSHAHGRLVDGLINVEAVKSFGRERLERERYAQVLGEWMSGSLANQRALSRLHVGQSAIIALGVAGVMLLAGDQTLRGQMTVGDLVLVNSYLIQICLPLNALGFVFRETRDALVNTERLFALLNQQPDIADRDHATTLRLAGGAIRFDNVAFGYEPGRPILQALDLEIPAGRTVAVVGGSGSGKSTLARLLLRLYDPAAGRVTIDGQDVRELTLASLRTAIGVVPQDTVLFNETIAFNIAVGRPGAPHEDIVTAARAAQVHEFIAALPAGYDTVVGERGLKLSGGEKQRIAIARAFLKNPPIMILDEATAALDSRSERAIQAELDRIAAGRTTLMIAHRLSTIVDADEIVVMDRGRIVERGRHADLLAANGLYAQLWTLQRQQQQVEQLERDLARQPINLAQLLAGTIDALQPALAARQVRLFTAIDTDEARVSGDPAALGQSLYEAAAAAVQSTPAGGRIELRLERAGPDARITILDGQRAGAPPPVPPLDDTLAELPPLDPPALRAALERQGGRVTIEPPNAARGRRVTFALPLMAVGVDRFVASNDGALAPLAPQPLAGLTLMVIDDALDARETLRMLLELDGAHVLAFASGREALAWLDAQPAGEWPAVLLSDIAMGDENGLDVMRAVRRLEARRGVPLEARLPAIALTGHGGAENRVQALMAGFQQHLAKPVQPRELVTTIYTLAGRHAVPGPRLATSAPLSGETSREKHR